MKSFNSALDLAKWILAHNFTPLRQEQLMTMGINNSKIQGKYIIILTIGDIEHCNYSSNAKVAPRDPHFDSRFDQTNEFDGLQEDDVMPDLGSK